MTLNFVLFAEATSDQAHLINGCLQRFCDSSGEIVSFLKSCVCFSSNVPGERVNEVSGILRIDHTDDLGFYLGMPTINGRVTKATFQHIIDKVGKRLSEWKAKCISLAGRTTLTKLVLSSPAYYSMQTIKIPRSVCDSVDRKSRMFIWGGSNDKKKIHFLSWNTLQRQRKEGGIGIRSMRQANATFLTKLGWRLLAEPSSLWDEIQCGNGRHTLFWDHCWASEVPLLNMAISPIPIEDQDKTVEEYWNTTGNSDWKWDELSTFLSPDSLKVIAFHYMPVLVYDLEQASTSHANNDSKGQMMFAITLWWLWKWRNTKIFGRNEEIPIDPIRFLHTKLKEMSDALLKDDMWKQGCYKIRKEVFIRWFPPPRWFGWMLNTEGPRWESGRSRWAEEFWRDAEDTSSKP
ncbi:hypothetical protein Tco_1389803 [Tanacetum coccineum]